MIYGRGSDSRKGSTMVCTKIGIRSLTVFTVLAGFAAAADDARHDELMQSITRKIGQDDFKGASADYERLIGHLKDTVPDGDERTVTALAESAELLDRKLVRRQEAISRFREALDLNRKLFPADSTTITILVNLATSHARSMDFDEAIKVLDDAEATISKVRFYQEKRLHEATIQQLRAGILHHQGDYETAYGLFEKAIQTLRDLVRNPPVASSS